jgi:regulator of nonsense transcripts 3
VKADYTFGQDAAARAYISFTNEEDIFTFRQQFDGYVFLDSTGEYSKVSGTANAFKFFLSVFRFHYL